MRDILFNIIAALLLSLILCFFFDFRFSKKEIILRVFAEKKCSKINIEYKEYKNPNIIKNYIKINKKFDYKINLKFSNDLYYINLTTINNCNLQVINIFDSKSFKNNQNIFIKNLKSKINLNYFAYSLLFFCFSFFVFISIICKKIRKYIDKQNSTRNKYYKNIEFLRIIFTIGIICAHLNISKTSICVEFFFIISGFFFSKSIDKFTDLEIKYYFIKRYIRLFPQYLFIMLFFHTKSFFQALIGFDIIFDRPLNKYDIFKNDLWFVPVLFWVENFLFCLYKYFNKKANFILAIIIFFSLRYYIYPCHNFYQRFMIRGISFTGIGCFLNLFHKNLQIITTKTNEYFITFIEIFSLTFLIKNIQSHPKLIISMWCFFILYLFILKKGALSKILNNNIFTHISKYCYSVYISHENISIYLFRKFQIYKIMYIKDDKLIIILVSFFVGFFFYHINDLLLNKILLKRKNNNIIIDKINLNQIVDQNNEFNKVQIK